MFALHHGTVWRILRRRGLAEDVAAEVTQQAFVLAAERLADIEATRERVFLVAHALKLVPPLLRNTRSSLHTEARAARPQDDPIAVRCCDLALARLSAKLAEIFVLYEIEGFSPNEIALLLELPLGRVAALLEQGRSRFRDEVAQRFGLGERVPEPA